VAEFTPCEQGVFRDVIGHFASGVTIITTRDRGVDFGVTANAVSSLSLEPPMMLVCLNRTSRTRGAIGRSKSFSVNILNESQGDLAVRFATGDDDKFREVAVRYGELGNPLLDGALAHLECRVIEQVSGGTHTVFLAGVERAERFEGAPLAYFRGRFGRLEFEQNVPAHADILDPVLSGYFYDALSFFTHG
jgi:flavin reductase (DIM6/NTAB) family NADH-FMN oxidoreductase RutF